MGKHLFGTDGIRGVAGEFPLDARTAHAFGAALGEFGARMQPKPEIVMGMDTRESGPWLASHICAGIEEAGGRVRFAGLITTPGIAYLTRAGDFVAGVMISASHNPYQDNGIKVFGHSGYKLPDQQEQGLERAIFNRLDGTKPGSPAPPKTEPGLDRLYADYLCSTFALRLDGLRMVVDCAHGAASRLAPEVFARLGARVHCVGCAPNGRNINLNCGSLHVEHLKETVVARKADVGVALDGDADRAILVSSRGKIVNGDGMLLIAGRALHSRGQLTGPGGKPAVVATVMSNLGLERALARNGIRLLRTPVGDKSVIEEMLRTGAPLGGEQSGHIIFHDYTTTGDGLLTTLRILEIMKETGQGLDELTSDLEIYPQRLVNVRVSEKKPLSELPSVNRAIHAALEHFGETGRVLVRFSGTEPLARVMVEGPELSHVEGFARSIAAEIQLALGSPER